MNRIYLLSGTGYFSDFNFFSSDSASIAPATRVLSVKKIVGVPLTLSFCPNSRIFSLGKLQSGFAFSGTFPFSIQSSMLLQGWPNTRHFSKSQPNWPTEYCTDKDKPSHCRFLSGCLQTVCNKRNSDRKKTAISRFPFPFTILMARSFGRSANRVTIFLSFSSV